MKYKKNEFIYYYSYARRTKLLLRKEIFYLKKLFFFISFIFFYILLILYWKQYNYLFFGAVHLFVSGICLFKSLKKIKELELQLLIDEIGKPI